MNNSRIEKLAQMKKMATEPLVIRHKQFTKLSDDNYDYQIENPSFSFSWRRKQSPGLSTLPENGYFNLGDVGADRWNKAVRRLNALSEITPNTTPPAANTTPAPTLRTVPHIDRYPEQDKTPPVSDSSMPTTMKSPLPAVKNATSSVRDIINRRLHKMAKEESTIDYNQIYSKYSSYAKHLSNKTPEELLDILATDIQEVGTADDGITPFTTGNLQLNAVGFLLGMNSIDNPEYIYSQLKRRLTSYGNVLYGKATLEQVLEDEEKGSYGTFMQAIEDGKGYKNYLNKTSPVSTSAANLSVDSSKVQEARKNFNHSLDSSSGSSSGSDQDNTAIINSDRWGKNISDTEYIYTIGKDGTSFDWESKEDNKQKGSHKQGDYKWGEMVKNLNAIPFPTATQAAAPAATPEAAAAPASSSESKNSYTSEESSLASVLANMYDNKLVGTPGLDLRNEVRVTKIIMDGVGGGVGKGKSYANAAARVLLNQNPGLAEILKGANYDSLIKNTEFLGSLQQAINGLYKTAFTWSKSLSRSNPSHAGFWKRIKSKSFDEQTASSIVGNYIREGLNFSYEGSGSATNKEISKAYSSNNKFIKAAKLRRLKVRSQMESAIDSSAQMGRSRI